MPARLDHIILNVNDMKKSIEFYTKIVGLNYDGERAGTPFSVLRVGDALMIQLAPFGTTGGQHLAFSVSPSEFDAVFERVRAAGLEYGDSFDTVGSMRAPGDSEGARGMWKAVYFFDPNKHLIEVAHY